MRGAARAVTSTDIDHLRSAVRTLLPAPLLLPEHYAAHFSALTALETAVRQWEGCAYDLFGVTLNVKRTEVHTYDTARQLIPVFTATLSVPGVGEARPYLEPGFSTARLRRLGAFGPIHRGMCNAMARMHNTAEITRGRYDAGRFAASQNNNRNMHDVEWQAFSRLKKNLEQVGELPGDLEIVARVIAVDAAHGLVTLELPTRWYAIECVICGCAAGSVGNPNSAMWKVMPCGHANTCYQCETALAFAATAMGEKLSCTLCGLQCQSPWSPPARDPSSVVPQYEDGFQTPTLWDNDGGTTVSLAGSSWDIRFEEAAQTAEAVAAALDAVVADRFEMLEPRLFPSALHAAGGGGVARDELLCVATAQATLARLEGCGRGSFETDLETIVASAAEAARRQTEAITALEISSTRAPSPAVLSDALLLDLPFADDLLTAQQRSAVRSIVLGAHGRVPYLLVGPAGCGKTRVICEAIFHLLARGSSVLLVAPSDAAADVALNALVCGVHEPLLRAIRLLPAGRVLIGQTGLLSPLILRLCSPARRMDALLHVRLLKYCLLQHGVFARPAQNVLAAAQLVVVTTAALSMLHGECVSFTHLVVDEAAQALEPETLAALCIAGPKARVTLVGDPRQLGADVRSEHARSKGYAISLMERLLAGRPSVGLSYSHTVNKVNRDRVRPYEALVRDALDIIKERQDALRSRYHHLPLPPGPFTTDEDDWSAEAAAEAEALCAAQLVRAHEAAPAALLAAATAAEGNQYEPVAEADGAPPSGSPLAHLFSTTLTTSFRSPFALLGLPSRLFYADTPLLSAVDAVEGTASEVHCSLSATVGAGVRARAAWPMLAIGVRGDDIRDSAMGDVLNVGNKDEADAVAFLVTRLLADGKGWLAGEGKGGGTVPRGSDLRSFASLWLPRRTPVPDEPAPRRVTLSQADIGVIAPFREAVQAVREALRKVDLYGVSVGLPRDFQGQEKTVIIVTTALSRHVGPGAFARRGAMNISPPPTLLGAASVPPAGLFFDARSLNVALTRARARLYVVGNPDLWLREPSWSIILKECAARSAYVGWNGAALPDGVILGEPKEGPLGIV